MKIFNEETNSRSGQCVIILDRNEARRLTEMAEAALKANPRKKTWKQIAVELETKLLCW